VGSRGQIGLQRLNGLLRLLVLRKVFLALFFWQVVSWQVKFFLPLDAFVINHYHENLFLL